MQAIRTFAATTLGVICAILASSLLTQQPASAIDKKTRSAFYLTSTEHPASQALTACAAGFHMASLWEIHDPSNLRYDTTLGYVIADSGNGPPASTFGWIRTGYVESASGDAGSANCNAWTATEPFRGGTVASLSSRWEFPAEFSSPWKGFALSCTASFRVWCVED